MPLGPAARLGPYEIVSAIGAGGMGEVYRARDTRLDRDVALKVVPELFASDPDRLARFEREAKTLAALNHPNIAQIYGLEESNGTRALVMELVEGEDLSQRIARGPIPIDDALRIAIQIAEALEGAHEQGIIHRDLKPANVKVRADGTVKVLDFGLAKAMDPIQTLPHVSLSPTITTPAATLHGVILGTAAYMAPEQARGKAVDKRGDIWAFACVLYEMLTGRRAFDGEDVADTLGAVIHKEPAWDALPAGTPPHLRHLLQRCFHKDPRQRMRDIGDVRIELQSAPHAALAQAPAPSPRSWMAWSGWALAIASTIGLVAALVTSRRTEQPAPADPVQFEILAPENSTFLGNPTVSPDGRTVVFGARGRDGRSQIWVREMGSGQSRPLPGTDGVTATPFWSPDSRFIAYVAGGGGGGNEAGNKLNKLDIGGGTPTTLCLLPGTYRGGTWNSSDDILFGVAQLGIWRITGKGGTPSRLTAEGMLPTFLPDGRHFLYTRTSGSSLASGGGLSIGVLGEGGNLSASEELIPDPSAYIYAPSPDPALGYVLFLRGTDLVAQPFDPVGLKMMGNAVQIASNILQAPTTFSFSASVTGALTYRAASGADDSRLLWFDREGRSDGQLGPPGRYGGVRLSIDGRTLVVVALTPQSSVPHVWTIDETPDVRRSESWLDRGHRTDDFAGWSYRLYVECKRRHVFAICKRRR